MQVTNPEGERRVKPLLDGGGGVAEDRVDGIVDELDGDGDEDEDNGDGAAPGAAPMTPAKQLVTLAGMVDLQDVARSMVRVALTTTLRFAASQRQVGWDLRIESKGVQQADPGSVLLVP